MMNKWPEQYKCGRGGCGYPMLREDGDNYYKHRYRCTSKHCTRSTSPLYGSPVIPAGEILFDHGARWIGSNGTIKRLKR